MTNSKRLHLPELYANLIPDNVTFAVRAFDSTLTGDLFSKFQQMHPLSESEYQSIRKAIPRREIEYRIGRSMVKELLGFDLLDNTTSLYKKSNGAPNWPQNITGSISHSGSTCLVAIADKELYPGLGVDIEEGVVDTELKSLIINHSQPILYPADLSQSAALRAVFCCKEAVFKALEARLTERIDFLDVDIMYQQSAEQDIYDFSIVFPRPVYCLANFNSDLLHGRVYANQDFSASVVIIESERQ